MWSVESKRGEQWDHTAWLCAHVVNAAGPKRPIQPKDCNPLKSRQKPLKGQAFGKALRGLIL